MILHSEFAALFYSTTFLHRYIVSVDNKFQKTYLVWKRGQSISTETVMQFTEEHVNKRFQAHMFLYCDRYQKVIRLLQMRHASASSVWEYYSWKYASAHLYRVRYRYHHIINTREKEIPYVLVFIAWYKYQKEGVHENKLPYVPTVLDSGNKMLFMKINRPTIALVCDNGTIGLFIKIFIAPLNCMI